MRPRNRLSTSSGTSFTSLGTLGTLGTLAALAVGPALLVSACASKVGPPPEDRVEGQTEFLSAPPGGDGSRSMSAADKGGAPAAPPADATKAPDATRKVEETDLYRLDGDRLYFISGYRGLMVFDVSVVDKPKLLGRSPIYGTPVEMLVRGGIASVVVSDWFGNADDGSPFHGSIVRAIDARDPAKMKVLGEAKLGGWVRDVRVVGDVMYAVSEDYGWRYAYADGVGVSTGTVPAGGGGAVGAKVIVSAVSIKGGAVKATGQREYNGWGGVFHVTSSAIMVAHDVTSPGKGPTGRTELQYIDISDPAGSIKERGTITVNGRVQGWGADNGRWNLDFADGTYAHTIGCDAGYGCYGSSGSYVLATVDFSNPGSPTVASELKIAATGWSPAARFVDGRMYLSPTSDYWSGSAKTTPIAIYDTKDPKAPKFAGSTEIAGNVWLFMPSGNRLFALGNVWDSTTGYWSGSKVALRYLDVTDATAPKVLGTSTFGDGWAWTPAAGTFKAFTKDDKQGLVVLPFSGWSNKDETYNNGLQLIEFDSTTIKTAGAAKTRGWVERGIFAKGRLLSLSDLSLATIDYSDRSKPKVVNELTLARNVVDAQPQGDTIAMLSTDWWDNDMNRSELRVLPITNAEETKSDPALAEVALQGTNARVFRNGTLAYVVTNVRDKATCSSTGGRPGPAPPTDPSGKAPVCYTWTQKVQVVDLADGKAVLRGSVKLPSMGDGYGYYWGWGGFYWYDWFDGDSIAQVGGDALAIRRWVPNYGPGGWESAKHALFVVDLAKPDAPTVASTTITSDPNAWWGNMRAVGNTLYTTHYDWITKWDEKGSKPLVKFYLDRIDLTNRSSPVVGSRVNVPGVLVGASADDPSLLYTIDYRWYSDKPANDLAVVKLVGDKAVLQGSASIDGWTGRVFVRGSKAYLSAELYSWSPDKTGGPRLRLHEVDLSNPKAPIDRVSSDKKGWGWLLGVEGDRAVVTSGWGNSGVDLYKLAPATPPTFDQFVRTRGWWSSSLSRQGNQLFLSSGYWGVQAIDLK